MESKKKIVNGEIFFECEFSKSDLLEISLALSGAYRYFHKLFVESDVPALIDCYDKKCDQIDSIQSKILNIVFN